MKKEKSRHFFGFFFFFSQKVKFWGLIFQSGPGNWQSTFWETAAIKFEKIQLLPLCYCTLWPNWPACGNWENSLYLIYWKRPGTYDSLVYIFNSNWLFWFFEFRGSMVQEQVMVFNIGYSFYIQTVRNVIFKPL